MLKGPALSRRFLEALKMGDRPAYRIAWAAGLHPATLSKLITGAERLKDNDQRVIAVGRELGLAPSDCFAPPSNDASQVA